MELIIDDRVINGSDMAYLNEGLEGTVYTFEDKAVKIYKPSCIKNRLSYKDAEKMMEIPTQFILLPRGLVFNTNRIPVGYYTIYHEKSPKDAFLKLNTSMFADRLDEVYGDLRILSDYNVSVEDLDMCNFVYDGHFRFVDPGSYVFEKLPKEVVLMGNKDMFSEFVTDEMFRRSMSLNKKEVQLLRNHFSFDSYIADTVRFEGKDDESIKRYVKRMIREEKNRFN